MYCSIVMITSIRLDELRFRIKGKVIARYRRVLFLKLSIDNIGKTGRFCLTEVRPEYINESSN